MSICCSEHHKSVLPTGKAVERQYFTKNRTGGMTPYFSVKSNVIWKGHCYRGDKRGKERDLLSCTAEIDIAIKFNYLTDNFVMGELMKDMCSIFRTPYRLLSPPGVNFKVQSQK